MQSGVFDADQQRTGLIAARTDAEKDLEATELQYAQLQERLKSLGVAIEHEDTTETSTEVDPNALTAAAQTQLLTLRQQEHELLERLQPTTPEVENIRNQIKLLEGTSAQIKDFQRVTTAPSPVYQKAKEELLMSEIELEPTSTHAAALRAAIASYDNQLRSLENSNLELTQLNTQIDTLQSNVRDVQQRLEQAQFQDVLDKSNVVSIGIIERASGSAKSVEPRKIIFLAGGVAAGMALAGLLLLIAVVSQNTLLTGESVERALNLPVLATIAARQDHPWQRRAA